MVTGVIGDLGVLVLRNVTKEGVHEPDTATILLREMAARRVLEKIPMFPHA